MSRYAEFDEYERLIKDLLSKKRFTHSMNVAEECYKLAETHGADKKRCYLAGLLHDVMKEELPEKQKQYVMESGLSPDPAEVASKSLWHGIAGGYYVREKLKIDDDEVISAIRYHTVGCARMTLLEKIVYLGDMVSADRSYKDVEKMRDYCYKDINVAMSVALGYQIAEVCGKCGLLPVSTFEAYNYYLKFNENKEHL
ncbi:MAG: bis(5'-nucleosyl)-tetraphosphatase (symmetrical) YqeK [Oscillospiraceae bacterium]